MTRDEALKLTADDGGPLLVRAKRSGREYEIERDVIMCWDGRILYGWPVKPHPRRTGRYQWLTWAGIEPVEQRA